MYLLDTNTLIYFFKGQGHVATHLLDTSPAEIALSTVVLYELETGIAKSADPAKRRAQLDVMLDVVQILPFDRASALRAAAIRAELEQQGQPIGPLDTLIAATALAHGAVLVTRNLREFSRVAGLNLVDWYGEG